MFGENWVMKILSGFALEEAYSGPDWGLGLEGGAHMVYK